MDSCVWYGTYVELQVWENGVMVCDGARRIQFGSDRSVFEMDCGNGARATVTDNNRKLTYTGPDGVTVNVSSRAYHSKAYKCGTANARWWETVWGETINSNGWCAKCPAAELCDFAPYCTKFDPSCRF